MEAQVLPTRGMAFLWFFLKRHGRSFAAIAFCMLFWSVNEAVYPYCTKLFVDAIANFKGQTGNIWPIIGTPFLILLGSFMLTEIAMRVMGIIKVYAFPKFCADMRRQIVDYVKDHSLSYFTDNFTGTVATRIHEVPKSSVQLIEQTLDNIFSAVFAFICTTIMLSTVSLFFAGMMLVWCAFHMAVTFYFLKEMNQKTSSAARCIAALNGQTVDFISNMLLVRLFSQSRQEMSRLRELQQVEIKAAQDASWVHQKVNLWRGSAGIIFITVMIYHLIVGWQNGSLSVGDFPLVAMTSFNIIALISNLSLQIQPLFRDYGVLNAALDILRVRSNAGDKPDAKPLEVPNGAIEFEKVNFEYRQGRPFFTDLSLQIKPGEKVGLVGFSGAGKSTLVNLILRFFNIQGGRILIDGQDIADATQDSLRSAVAMIPQNPSLFHRTLLENIRYGNPDASDEAVIEAARLAHCSDFIEDLEEGYDTPVGERGLKLSADQRQRIAIARAILKDAPILIMDEATSALDSATTKLIQESLNAVMKERTTLVIAHSLSTLAAMDRILVFDKGQLIEQGTQESLLRKKESHFSHLWSLQKEGLLPKRKNSRKKPPLPILEVPPLSVA